MMKSPIPYIMLAFAFVCFLAVSGLVRAERFTGTPAEWKAQPVLTDKRIDIICYDKAATFEMLSNKVKDGEATPTEVARSMVARMWQSGAPQFAIDAWAEELLHYIAMRDIAPFEGSYQSVLKHCQARGY